MVQNIQEDAVIEVTIKCYDNSTTDPYMAYVIKGDYHGLAVSAKTLPEVMKELSISLTAMELHRKNLKNKK